MSQEVDYLSRCVAAGRLSRREFIGRATALGVSVTFANSFLASAARAQAPVRGGIIKGGLHGGEAIQSLDPAVFMTLPASFGSCWGEYLVVQAPDGSLEHRIAEEIGSSKDAKVWTFKIRQDVEFHNGKTVTAEDVVATLERHSNKESKSGALGILANIERLKVDGRNVTIALKEPDAELPFLMTDYHLVIQPNGGKDNPAEGISASARQLLAV